MIVVKNLKFGLVIALILVSALFVGSAMGAPSIERDVTVSGDTATITFTVNAEEPYAVGIVETVPEGWTFAAGDSGVSSSKDFEVDRDNNKIAFFLSNEDSASYRVTGSGDGSTGFTSEWVDLLYLSPDLDEGKERWNTIGEGSNTVTKSEQESGEQKSPGFGAIAAIIAFAITGTVLFASGRKEA